MTTKSNNPKAPRDCKETQPSTKGVVAVSHRLKALSLMPLHALAEGRNQTIPSLLCDLTGLSKARISKGNLDAVRPSTKAKINLHLEELLQVQFKDDPEGLDELMSKVATSPVTSSGEVAPLAGWVHQLEFLPWIPLPATKAVALTVDELLEALLACCREDDLPNFKTVLLTHFKRHGLAVCADGQIAMDPVPETELAALQAMANWEHADQWTRNLVDYLYWDLISSLDAEWNSHYFAGRQTMSLFPLVMVRPQEGLLETMRVSSRKIIYLKPVRRLLQFLYALAFYFRYKRWPARAPTPKTLAEILYRPGSLELADESLISNYFDGSKTAPCVPIYETGASSSKVTGLTDLYAVQLGLDAFHGVSLSGSSIIKTYMPDLTAPGAVKKAEVEMVAAVALKNTTKCGVFRNIKVS